MICASKPLSVLDYATDFYVPDRLDLAPGSLQQIRIAIGLLDRFHQSPVALERLSREFLIDWMRWLADVPAAGPGDDQPEAGGGDGHLDRCGGAGAGPAGAPIALALGPRAQADRAGAGAGHLVAAGDRPHLRRCCKAPRRLGRRAGVPVLGIGVPAVLGHGRPLGRGPGGGDAVHGRRAQDALHAGGAPQGAPGTGSTRCTPRRWRSFVRRCPARGGGFSVSLKHRQYWSHLKQIVDAAGLPSDKKHMYHCLRRSAESTPSGARADGAADAVGHAVEVARRSYISPLVHGPQLVKALPRPTPARTGAQLPAFSRRRDWGLGIGD